MLPTTRFGKLKEGWRRYKREGKAGDFAILKADAFGATVTPHVAKKLAAVRGFPPEIDLDHLGAMPVGSFGRHYADFMQANTLKPFLVSADMAPIVERNTFAVRYAATHDMFHVLLGFEISLAGEMGVLAFAAAQGYHKQQKVGLMIATVLYPLLSPFTFRAIFRAKRRGAEMGRRAVFLLGERLEEKWEVPLDQLRAELGISQA